MNKTLVVICALSTNLFYFTSFSQTVSEIQCNNIEITLNAEGRAEITPLDLLVTDELSNAQQDFDLSVEKSEFYCNDLGSNTVRLTAMYEDGSTLRCEGRVKVLDMMAPEAFCKDIEVQETTTLEITSDMLDNGSFDNCSMEFEVEETSTETFETQTKKTYLMKVKDASGNTSECSSEVTLLANSPDPVDEVNFDHISEATSTSKGDQSPVKKSATKEGEVSIISIDEDALGIFPNPASDYIIFKAKNKDQVFSAQIMNSSGVVLKKFSSFTTGEKLSLDGLESGTFLFELSVNGRAFKKIRLIVK